MVDTQQSQNPFGWTPLLALPVLLPLVLLQGTLFSYLVVGGVVVQMAVVVVIAVGLWRDSAESLIWAVIAGLLLDINSMAPLGSSAIALMLAMLAIAPFRSNLAYNRVVLPILLAAIAMLVYLLASLIIYRVSGIPTIQEWVGRFPARIAVHALIAVPLYWLLQIGNLFNRRPSQINL